MITTRFEPPALHEILPAAAAGIRVVATDIDGTITAHGALAPSLLEALARLADADIETILVSGRPAGEVLGLCRYLPGVQRGVAENGLVAVDPQRGMWPLVSPSPYQRQEMRMQVQALSRELDIELDEANDAFARVVDLAFDRRGHSDRELGELATRAQQRGLHCIWSSVHVHFSHEAPDKGRGVLAILGATPAQSVATMGDALNDYGLFRRGTFGLCTATADFRSHLPHVDPAYFPDGISVQRELAAFLELVELVLAAQPRASG